MSVSIKLYANDSDPIALDKELTLIDTMTGVFREECDIRDPIILIEAEPADLTGINYFEIEELGRFYFLTTAPRIIRSGLIEISGHCDVLHTFADDIRSQKAIIQRSESADAYNLYLNDGSLRAYQNPYVLTEPFPSGFTGASFVLAVAGYPEATP